MAAPGEEQAGGVWEEEAEADADAASGAGEEEEAAAASAASAPDTSLTSLEDDKNDSFLFRNHLKPSLVELNSQIKVCVHTRVQQMTILRCVITTFCSQHRLQVPLKGRALTNSLAKQGRGPGH